MMSDTTTILGWFYEFGADVFAAFISIAIVMAYYVVLRARVRRNPAYSVHYVNELARRLWVENVMNNPGKDIMAVQSLRNFIMVGILMVSTASLLIIGTLTLSGQVESISRSWHAITIVGSHSAGLWIIKVMCLLIDFLIVFFSYAMALRLANQVLFMLNVPKESLAEYEVLTPNHVARRLNLAGHMMAIGMRTLFFAIPLVFWLFGPIFFLLATVGVTIIVSRLDQHQAGL